jgi:hypothetical protein
MCRDAPPSGRPLEPDRIHASHRTEGSERMGKRWVVALAVGLVCLGAVGSSAESALAAFPSAADFADWTAVSNNVATGTLLGHTITFSGTAVDDPPGSTIDGTSNLLSESMFTPPIALGDHLSFRVFAPSTSYTLDFGAATTDPVIDLGSDGSTLTFPAGTSITRISGDPGLTVAGNVVNGAGNTTVDPVGLNDSNGTIQLNGTFQSISFSATTAYPLDGVYLQVGASPPPPPPPPPPSGGAGGTAPPPAPQVTSLRLGGSSGAGAASRALVTAQFAGQASQLEWYVAGSHRPVLTTSAALSTLRFHQSPTGSIVGVRAIGPGGASPIVQMRVPPLPLPAGSIAKKIGAGVHAGGPVFFATSNPASLLRNGLSAEICALTGPSRISAEGGLLDIKGCALPLQSLGQLPPSLKGIVVDMANRYHIPVNTADANLGLRLSDAYRAIGSVVVNGMTINAGADGMVIFPQVHVIAAANAKLSIGAVNLASPLSGPFQIDTSPRFGRIPLGTFHSLPGTVLVPGFAVVGDVSVTAVPPSGNEPGGTAITAKLQLPSWLSVGGVSADATVDLRATTDSGLMLDSMQSRVQNVNIGPVQIRNFQIKYTRAPGNGLLGDRWEGQGVACVPFGGCIDMAPPHGGIRIVDGQPDFIGASLQFNPHLTLFPGIDLSEIGFAFGQNPTRFLVTTAEVFASDILRLDGRIVVAFPAAGDPPYTLRQDAAFLDPPGTPSPFSPQQYTIPHTAFTLAASVQAALTLPVVGDVPVGNAYFIYEYPGYIAFGGGIPGQSLLGLGQVSGGVSGEVNFTNGRYDIFGNINVCTGIDCPNGLLTVSYGGDVNFSDVGMSVCVRPSVFPDFGIGIYWPGRFPTDWHLQGPGCRWSPYADKNVHGSADRPGARAVAASLPYTFTVHRRDAGLSIQLAGTGGAPRVRVIAPGGRTIDSPTGDGIAGTQRLMIVRFDRMQITSVGMRHGVPGTYRIVALPGSVPVSQIATATPLPDAKITASVHGQGTHRILSYDIARRPGQQVRFLEVTASGAARTIATVTRAGRGSLPFTTAPGTGTRSIVAQCELARLPAERITVAHFRPPSPRLGSIRSLRVDRSGTNIRTSWDAMPGASGYEMVLTTDGSSQRRVRVRGTAVTLRGVAGWTAGRVSVRAVDTLREGPIASAPFKATASPRTRFGRVPKAPPLR